ncbi:MAG: tRNA pseudouridine(54/55) synthase Pus10 [Candidatus Micrarchaeota archaeon]|nr:tRNA pseudouridine(54/55) synthase Pus10 [Candidatus Micrarchaeota archaeon]
MEIKTAETAKEMLDAANGFEFGSFSVSTSIPWEKEVEEEETWSIGGPKRSEKSDLNERISRIVEKKSGKKFNPWKAEVRLSYDFSNFRADAEPLPLFVYGNYLKNSRELSQSRWKKRGESQERESIERIMGEALREACCASGYKLHGCGREDIDARMLGNGRPFVLEIVGPKKRKIDLRACEKEIAKSKIVEAIGLRFVPKEFVEFVKNSRLDKSYRAKVKVEMGVSEDGFEKIKKIAKIRQRTPKRVLHRRTDKIRERGIRKIEARKISENEFELIIRAEAGTYIKELISGDDGRTSPSVSEILGAPAVCTELDVIGIDDEFVRNYW